MTLSDPLKEVTALLCNAVGDLGDVDGIPVGRDPAIMRIAEALSARRRARRRTRVMMACSLAAGLLLVGGGAFAVIRGHAGGVRGRTAAERRGGELGRLVPPTATAAVRDGRNEPIEAGARLAEGTELWTTSSAEATLDFENGTHVAVGRHSRVRLLEQGTSKRFALATGSISAKVAKLKPNERFVVVTSDSEIEVRGTAFRVEIVSDDATCASGTPTRVDVLEGVVVVTHAGALLRVGAGEHWPPCSVSAAASAPLTPVGQPRQPASVPSVHERPSSSLVEQNDLYEDALRLRRSGDASGAVAQLDRLLLEFPGGPLAENAEVERMRGLATSNAPRATAAARDYLDRHPDGFARSEAEAIVAENR